MKIIVRIENVTSTLHTNANGMSLYSYNRLILHRYDRVLLLYVKLRP